MLAAKRLHHKNMSGHLTKQIIFIVLCVILSGCGFHVRNGDALPPQLHTLYLQSDQPYGQFEITLKRALQKATLNVVNTPTAAPIALQIINTRFTHDTPTIGDSSQARVYNFTYTVTFSITNTRSGHTLLLPRTVSMTRALTINANQVIDSNNDVDIAQRQMQRGAIMQILNIFF